MKKGDLGRMRQVMALGYMKSCLLLLRTALGWIHSGPAASCLRDTVADLEDAIMFQKEHLDAS